MVLRTIETCSTELSVVFRRRCGYWVLGDSQGFVGVAAMGGTYAVIMLIGTQTLTEGGAGVLFSLALCRGDIILGRSRRFTISSTRAIY